MMNNWRYYVKVSMFGMTEEQAGWICLTARLDPSFERMIYLALTLGIHSLNFPNLVDFVNLMAILYVYKAITR